MKGPMRRSRVSYCVESSFVFGVNQDKHEKTMGMPFKRESRLSYDKNVVYGRKQYECIPEHADEKMEERSCSSLAS